MSRERRSAGVRWAQAALITVLCPLINANPVFSEGSFSFFEEEAKVITVSRKMESIREAPANVTVITEEQIKASGARTLADVLALLPGVQITTHRKGSEKIWFRGVTATYNDKSILLIDGYPYKELIYGQFPIDEQLPLTAIKRVEVVKGPGSVVYGAGALSGVINIITKDPEDVRGAELRTGYGSWHTQDQSLLLSHAGENGSRMLVGVNYSDSFGAPHGRDEKGNITSKRDPNRLTASQIKLRVNEFILGARYSEHNTHYLSYPDAKIGSFDYKTTSLNLGWGKELNENISLHSKAYLNYFDWFQNKRNLNASSFALEKLEERQETTQVAGVGMDSHIKIGGAHDLVAGADFEGENGLTVQQFSYNTKKTSPPPVLERWADPVKPKTHNLGIFAEDSWRILGSKLLLVGGLRHDQHSHYGSSLSPRSALLFNPSDPVSAKLIYGKAFRAPSFRELYITETGHEDDGDPNLKPEKIETWEFITQIRPAPFLQASLSLFQNNLKRFITVDPATKKYANRGKQHIQGAEPEIRWAPSGIFSAFVNGTWLEARDQNGESVEAVARQISNAGVDVKMGEHFNLNATLNHVGKRTRPSNYQSSLAADNKEDHLGAYDHVNAALTSALLPVELTLAVYNALNVRSFNPNYLEGNFDIEHPRRSFMAYAAYKF